jgi:cytochrome c
MKYILAVVAILSCFCISCSPSRVQAATSSTGGDPALGKDKIASYGCGSCHTIPGVVGASGLVGPPLAGIGNRVYIAGILLNNSENIARWIENPHAIDQLTVMPNVHATPEDARDMAGPTRMPARLACGASRRRCAAWRALITIPGSSSVPFA